MLKELFEAIGTQAIQARSPNLHAFDPTKDYVSRKPDGALEILPAGPNRRHHVAGDLVTVYELANRFAKKQTVSIWYYRTGIVCLFNDEDRREDCKLPLTLSPQVIALNELETSRRQLEQKSLLMLLRNTFKGCHDANGDLVAAIRHIEWEVKEQGNAEIGRGKRSIGKAATAELKGVDRDFPEYVTMDVPVFGNAFPDIRMSVQCMLEPIELQKQFQFFPVAGEIEKGLGLAEDEVGKQIRDNVDKGVLVYYGVP